MSHGEAGKGDRTRPFNQKKWDEGWERVFGKKPTFFEAYYEGVEELDEILKDTNEPIDEGIMDIPEKLEQAQGYLDEILKEMGQGTNFCTNKWYRDKQNPSVATMFLDVMSSASIDLSKGEAVKSTICERMIKGHKDVIRLMTQTVEKLQRIKDAIGG